MTNPNDEFASDNDFDTDLGFDAGEPDKGARNNALLKIGMIAGGLVVVLVGIFMLGGTSEPQVKSSVSAPATDSVGGEKADPTPEYREAVEAVNNQRLQNAKETGGSVLPISPDPAQEQLQVRVTNPEEDAAERLRRIQAEYDRAREQEQSQVNVQQQQAEAQARAQAVQGMSQAMSSYLSSASSLRQPARISEMDVAFTTAQGTGSAGSGGVGSGMGSATASGTGASVPKTILPAATIEYGQLLIEANTDAPGPVLALIASGKLSGSRLLGSFQKTDEYLTLNFNQLVTKDGRAIPVQAIVLDPDTTLPGMVTEIDRRYFQRYILPAAAEFVSGVGQALAETQQETTQTSSSTTTTSNEPDFSDAIAQGISDSFDGLSEAITEEGRRTQPMLRIAAGTPVGILFTDAVLDQTNAERAADLNVQSILNAQQQGLGQLYMPGFTQNPGTTGYQLPSGNVMNMMGTDGGSQPVTAGQ